MVIHRFYEKNSIESPYATRVETTTCIKPGIMNEWLSRYFPITVVPETDSLV